MIILYTSPGCASCRKAKQWLKDNDMKFVEKNIFTTLLKEEEIKYLLQRSENGTEDIISTRSKAFQNLNRDLEDISVKELIEIIRENPSILKRPIMINESSFVVGYDDDEITALVPAKLRLAAQRACNLLFCQNKCNYIYSSSSGKSACNPTCPNFSICGYLREEACSAE